MGYYLLEQELLEQMIRRGINDIELCESVYKQRYDVSVSSRT